VLTDDDLSATRTRDGTSSPAPDPAAHTTAHFAAHAARIGAYHVLRELGAGGMGVVYSAYHEDLERKVALKLVRPDGHGTIGGRAQIRREAQALARLSHPNVVQIYEVGEHDGQLFVAMEHVHGETLDVWQRRPGRTLGEILDAYRQAATGLAAAHDAGLVHRDFKPHNAIVGADGRVRVLDFGLARAHLRPSDEPAADLPAADLPAADLDQTVGSVAGTPAYMSPEQFAGHPLDARSDIFSFCVALSEALHGRRPFAGESYAEIEANVLAGARLPAPADVALSGRLQHALARGLEPAREARWATLGPLIDALATDPDADPTSASRERRSFFAVIVAVMLLVSVPLLVVGVTHEHLDRRLVYLLVSGSGLVTLIVASLVFRRVLLRNVYHRRLILFVGAFMLTITSQRAVALLLDASARQIVLADAHVLLAVCLTGAIFFARWMLVLAAIIAVAALTGLLVRWQFPVGIVVGPLFILTFGYFWRRDARRGAG
jgi:predicted Ser/Thr protein kinase